VSAYEQELERRRQQEQTDREQKQLLRARINRLFGIQQATPDLIQAATNTDPQLAALRRELAQFGVVTPEMAQQQQGIREVQPDGTVVTGRTIREDGSIGETTEIDGGEGGVTQSFRVRSPESFGGPVHPRLGRILEIRRAIDARTAAIPGEAASADNEAAANLRAREDRYGKLASDVTAYHTRDLREQQERAARMQRFSLADRGLLGGSQQVDEDAELRRASERGLRDIEALATNSVNQARQDDEESRLDLMNRVNAGIDEGDAISGALSRLTSSTARALDFARGQQFGQFFAGLGNVAQQGAAGYGQGQGERMARDYFGRRGATVGGGGSTYQGTPIRG